MRERKAAAGLAALKSNPYPGRIVIMGDDDTGNYIVQVAVIMGRSEGSRNRVYVQPAGGYVRTALADPGKPSGDPALTLYDAMLEQGNHYVVSNGHQTNTVLKALAEGGIFEDGLKEWQTEPDPNRTPRITATYSLIGRNLVCAQMAIHRRARDGTEICPTWDYSSDPWPGVGRCLQTYIGEGNPLPSYKSDPYFVPLNGDIHEVLQTLWEVLNEANRVAIAVKFIPKQGGTSSVCVHNKYKQVS